MISKEVWEKNTPNENPFLKFEFFYALFESGCIGAQSGWTPACLIQDGILLNFEKTHSYGEYIFDWAWAEAFVRHAIPYYPKSTSMIPFTPVTTRHFLQKEFDPLKADVLLKKHDDSFQKSELSSAHFLFLHPEEIEIFKKNNYLIRESFQYHFFNHDYQSFEHFLTFLKTKKAKNIRNERNLTGLEIRKYTGSELTKVHAHRMYQFYISTIVNKNSYDYLNDRFFELIFETMKEHLLYVEASSGGSPVGGSLFFYDHLTLYGRYWGSNTYIENLHFELCYYQGIDFCISRGLQVFEAGAQGEHKIARGFKPVRTYSAHKIKNDAFSEAISGFINSEKGHVQETIEKLSLLLPFK